MVELPIKYNSPVLRNAVVGNAVFDEMGEDSPSVFLFIGSFSSKPGIDLSTVRTNFKKLARILGRFKSIKVRDTHLKKLVECSLLRNLVTVNPNRAYPNLVFLFMSSL